MTREPTITYHDFVNALGEPVYAFKVHCHSNAEREARVTRAKSGPVAEAYTPFGHAGEPYDPPEHAPQPVSASYTPGAVSGGYPPNCDGNAQYGHEPTQVGQLIAQAGFTAAEGDSECSTVGCVIPQVRDNGSA